jgi:hypothetical protein
MNIVMIHRMNERRYQTNSDTPVFPGLKRFKNTMSMKGPHIDKTELRAQVDATIARYNDMVRMNPELETKGKSRTLKSRIDNMMHKYYWYTLFNGYRILYSRYLTHFNEIMDEGLLDDSELDQRNLENIDAKWVNQLTTNRG